MDQQIVPAVCRAGEELAQDFIPLALFFVLWPLHRKAIFLHFVASEGAVHPRQVLYHRSTCLPHNLKTEFKLVYRATHS